eukprot:TRINITY_DN21322_c0_g1_i1.p1 TRINITY_DN21322_c0_g1~~TRINITY_DN21322_c0_g1_i1.p1  ORF type:complete len:659 (+),score=53.81 TRINITY_DN21322_c0_g1_i1:56-2032(+)
MLKRTPMTGNMWLVQRMKSDLEIKQPKVSEIWRFKYDEGGKYSFARGPMGLKAHHINQRDVYFQRARQLYHDCIEKRHSYDEMSNYMEAHPRPVGGGSERIQCLYGCHTSDVKRKPTKTVPVQHVVAPDTSVMRKYPKLYFLLHYYNLTLGGPQAIINAGKALKNASITPINPVDWCHGVNSIWCVVENASPAELKEALTSDTMTVSGVTHQQPENFNSIDTTVVLRGIQIPKKELLKHINYLMSDDGSMFPNYINWDQVGLHAGAGVFSHPASIEIGKKILSSDYDEAVRLIIRHVTRANYGLKSAEEDLENKERNRFSARFYNQIPRKYGWIKDILDIMANSPMYRGWSPKALSAVPDTVLNRFTQAAAASVWNQLARERLKISHEGSIPGDLVELSNGDIVKCKVHNEYSIDKVVLKTLGFNTTHTAFPDLRRVLNRSNIDFENFNGSHLPKSQHRKLVGIASNVTVEARSGNLFEWVQPWNDVSMLRSTRTHLNLKGVKSLLFTSPWQCIPCAKSNPASATRCWTCGEHRIKCNGAPEKQCTTHTTSLKIKATLPIGSSPASFLSEIFDLRQLVGHRDDLYLKTLEGSLDGRYKRPSKFLRRRKKVQIKQPVRPRYFQTMGPIKYETFTPPSSPMGKGEVKLETVTLEEKLRTS